MNDREFLELLNLYVDHEISPEDALRLEAEVAEHPRRRKVYDQYCRIQKACVMLSEELSASSERGDAMAAAFPVRRSWVSGPLFAGLAVAAACLLVFLGLRNRAPVAGGAAPLAASDSARTAPAADPVDLPHSSDSMKPVFFTHLPAAPSARSVQGQMLADTGVQLQMDELNWIGDIHLAPVDPGLNPDYLLTPRPDTKSAVLSGPQSDRDSQEPAEMTAFRFQR